ncbi:MAG: O-antigen ligase family protein [Bacteroidales bacterium]|nr:O-antigen ligase family protein [Bacteroidales bacterium]
MLTSSNPFEKDSGSAKLGSPKYYLPLFAVSIACAWVVSHIGIVGGMGIMILPFMAAYLILLFQKPILGVYTAVGLGFVILGIMRYVDIPMTGLSIDAILLLTFLSLIFKNFYTNMDWTPAKKDITLLAGIWFAYGLLSFLNPEIRNYSTWLSSFRGISVYMLLVITLTLLLMTTNKRVNYFFYVWGIFSVLASLKGIIQVTIGVDHWEKAWLDAGANSTHMLFGKLRVFSFLSDAGQFGATQAYSGVVFIILSFIQKDIKKKVFYLVVGFLGIYGMFLSGTRGAISVPLAGFMLYFILKGNKAVLISGFAFLVVVFIFFKYTTIGQDVQQIRRMRTAFDPNDASLQTRLANQKTLSRYLASRPFGGGLGHAGKKAKKALPNTFLANIATDSWFVMIWAEQGVVGLVLHLFILFYIVIKASYLVMYKIRDPIVKMNTTAMAAGMLGVMVASYGNAVLGQVPTSMLIYTSMALMLNSEKLDEEAMSNKSSVESVIPYKKD